MLDPICPECKQPFGVHTWPLSITCYARAIDQAKSQERERCAKIVEEHRGDTIVANMIRESKN